MSFSSESRGYLTLSALRRRLERLRAAHHRRRPDLAPAARVERRRRAPRGWSPPAPSAAFLLADSSLLAVHDVRWRSRRALQGHDPHRAAHRAGGGSVIRVTGRVRGARGGRPGAGGAARARRERLGRPGGDRRLQRHLHDQVALAQDRRVRGPVGRRRGQRGRRLSRAASCGPSAARPSASSRGGMSRRSRSRVSSSRRAELVAAAGLRMPPSAIGRRRRARAGAPSCARRRRRVCSNASRGRVTLVSGRRRRRGASFRSTPRGAHDVLAHPQLLRLEAEREPDELRQVQDGQAEVAADDLGGVRLLEVEVQVAQRAGRDERVGARRRSRRRCGGPPASARSRGSS